MGVRLCAKVDVGWRYSVIRPSNYTVLRLRPVSLPLVEGRVVLTASLRRYTRGWEGGGATETLQVYLVNYTCKLSDSLSGRFWNGFLNESNERSSVWNFAVDVRGGYVRVTPSRMQISKYGGRFVLYSKNCNIWIFCYVFYYVSIQLRCRCYIYDNNNRHGIKFKVNF